MLFLSLSHLQFHTLIAFKFILLFIFMWAGGFYLAENYNNYLAGALLIAYILVELILRSIGTFDPVEGFEEDDDEE